MNKNDRLSALMTFTLFVMGFNCVASPHHSPKKPQAVVIDVGDFNERYGLPLQKLAEVVQEQPKTRLFRVSGTLMFGGWQTYTFWYDRQTQRLRYTYASGGETYCGEKQSIWAGVTETDIAELAKITENVSSESFFKTLKQLGCSHIYYHEHLP